MNDTMTVAEFEQRVRIAPWLDINRLGLEKIAHDLDAGADHIDRVGWTQKKNFENPDDMANSPCCAVGSLHALTRNRGYHDRIPHISNIDLIFEALHGGSLVGLNDLPTSTAADVTEAMRHVAWLIRTYLAATA